MNQLNVKCLHRVFLVAIILLSAVWSSNAAAQSTGQSNSSSCGAPAPLMFNCSCFSGTCGNTCGVTLNSSSSARSSGSSSSEMSLLFYEYIYCGSLSQNEAALGPYNWTFTSYLDLDQNIVVCGRLYGSNFSTDEACVKSLSAPASSNLNDSSFQVGFRLQPAHFESMKFEGAFTSSSLTVDVDTLYNELQRINTGSGRLFPASTSRSSVSTFHYAGESANSESFSLLTGERTTQSKSVPYGWYQWVKKALGLAKDAAKQAPKAKAAVVPKVCKEATSTSLMQAIFWQTDHFVLGSPKILARRTLNGCEEWLVSYTHVRGVHPNGEYKLHDGLVWLKKIAE